MTGTRTSLVIVEDFYDDPAAVRAHARSRRWYHPYQSDEAVRRGTTAPKWISTWFAEATDCPFKSSAALIERLEALTGETIDREHWEQSFPIDEEGKAARDCESHARTCLWNCCFHVKPTTDQALGEGVHNHVTDIWNSVGPDGWAGIVYLTADAPPSGGLKLWRNRDPARTHDWMTPPENWDLIDDIGNVCNRLILARGNLPHSGAAGWGSGIDDGRLFQTFFFKTRPRPSLAPLTVVA